MFSLTENTVKKWEFNTQYRLLFKMLNKRTPLAEKCVRANGIELFHHTPQHY